MKSWSLQVQFACYASLLTSLALLAAALVLLPFIYQRQLRELDGQLAENAQELFRDLRNFKGAPTDPRRPVSAKFVPVALRLRYIELEGPEGQVLYRSNNLRSTDLTGEAGSVRTMPLFGRKVRIATYQDGPWMLHVGTRLGTIERMQADLRSGLLVAVPIATIAAFLFGLLLGRRAIKPVADLTAAAERIRVECPEERLPVPPSRDEIARLTAVLNRSFDRLQRSYEAASRFSADASHQLKTPVSVLRIGLEELRTHGALGPPEQEEVSALLRQTRRLTTLIEDLLLLAQADAGRLDLQPQEMDLLPLLSVAWDDLEAAATTRSLVLEKDLPPHILAVADARRVSLILQNLVENALKYTPEGGRVRLSAQQEDDLIAISLGNSGTAIVEQERERIFDRFHRGQVGEAVKGHGLGLNIARELARAHGGDLVLARSDEQWTEFILSLPASRRASVP